MPFYRLGIVDCIADVTKLVALIYPDFDDAFPTACNKPICEGNGSQPERTEPVLPHIARLPK